MSYSPDCFLAHGSRAIFCSHRAPERRTTLMLLLNSTPQHSEQVRWSRSAGELGVNEENWHCVSQTPSVWLLLGGRESKCAGQMWQGSWTLDAFSIPRVFTSVQRMPTACVSTRVLTTQTSPRISRSLRVCLSWTQNLRMMAA